MHEMVYKTKVLKPFTFRNRPLVDVVVDPVICQHLRDHQRQGVTFMYECLMDMKDYGGEGVLLADESTYIRLLLIADRIPWF